MKQSKIPLRYRVFYVIHFDHDEYLRLHSDDGELVMTTSYLKARRYDDSREAIKVAEGIIKAYEPEDIGTFLAIVQVTLGRSNPLLTALRRVRVVPF